MNWYFEVLKKYAVFDGRAPRSEYWMFALISVIIVAVLSIVAVLLKNIGELAADGVGALALIYIIAIFLPLWAVSVRRLHDTGHSGWWLLIFHVPFFFLAMDGTPGTNRYGANPKGVEPGAAAASAAASAAIILDELDQLKQRGLITDREYEDRKKVIISNL